MDLSREVGSQVLEMIETLDQATRESRTAAYTRRVIHLGANVNFVMYIVADDGLAALFDRSAAAQYKVRRIPQASPAVN
jgi:hypothetical protein